MKVWNEYIIGCSQSHYYFFDFARFNKQAGDFIFIEAPINFDKVGLEWVKRNKIVYLELEEPNRFFLLDWFNHLPYDPYFRRIFSICPYTCEWLNAKYGDNIRTPVFIPLNEKIMPSPGAPKKYDVLYAGHVFPGEITRIIDDITRFNYRLISNSDDQRVTNHGASNDAKLRLMAETKITIAHNLLFLADPHINNVARIGCGNKAFELARSHRIVPQIKGRTFEAAFCRSLILCRRDPFNIIERFFAPDEEFVYYEEEKLGEMIDGILDNYSKYEKIVNNAYKRAMAEYTTQRFFDKYLKKLRV